MKLHLGAFNQSVEGWINTDITPHLWIAKVPLLPFVLYKLKLIPIERYDEHQKGIFKKLKYLNLTKNLPFQSESIEAVFSSHVFEHLFIDEVEKLIAEIHRVLLVGGICRVLVPDLEKIVADFDCFDPRDFLNDVFEAPKRGAVKNQHHSGFTGPFLIKLFSDSGFSKCEIMEYKKGACPDVELLDNRPESLFFEAVK